VYAPRASPSTRSSCRTSRTTTGGQFFRAADRAQLARSFHTILDQLERSRIADAGVRYGELYPWLVVAALALLALEALLASTRLRRFP
jgi:hypothetical protein